MSTNARRLPALMALICCYSRCFTTTLAFAPPPPTTTKYLFQIPTTENHQQLQQLRQRQELLSAFHNNKQHCRRHYAAAVLYASRTTDQITAAAAASMTSSTSSSTPSYMSTTSTSSSYADDFDSSFPPPPTFFPPQKTTIASPSSSSSLPDVVSTETLPLQYLALAGLITTFFADILMHPMDSIKTYQQQDIGLHVSLVQAATHLWTHGGLYHGFLTYAISDCLAGAVKFSVWETWKTTTAATKKQQQLLQQAQQQPDCYQCSNTNKSQNSNNNGNNILELATGAALAFVASSVILVPGEYMKNQLQVSHYHGFWEAATGIFQTSGLSGFYTGYQGVLFRDVPYTMLELGLYEVFKKYFVNQQQQQQSEEYYLQNEYANDEDDGMESTTATMQQELMAAAMTGAITAFLTTPLDTIKTTLMIQDSNHYQYHHLTDHHFAFDLSFLDCFLDILDQHGVMGLFAGVWARMAWVVPFTVIYLPTYDWLKRQFALRLSNNNQVQTQLHTSKQQQQEL